MNTVSKLLVVLALSGCDVAEESAQGDFFSLNGGSYPVTIDVIITPDTEAAAQYVRDNLDSTIQASDFDGSAAITFDFQDGKPGIIWLESATFDPQDISIINHELLHATLNTMRYSGVSLSDSSEEAYAYQLQYYSNQFYNKIKQ
jgi:hypothetical protein